MFLVYARVLILNANILFVNIIYVLIIMTQQLHIYLLNIQSQCQHTLASIPTLFKCTPRSTSQSSTGQVTISNIDILNANKTVSLISDGQDINFHLTVGVTSFWVVFDYNFTNGGALNNVFDIYINSAVSNQWGSPIYSTTAGMAGRKEIFFSSISTDYDFSFVSKIFRRDFIDVNIGILVRTYTQKGKARDGDVFDSC
eukprot:UN02777